MALSDTWLRAQVKKQIKNEIVKHDRDGLAARVRNGRVTFIYRPYFNGKQIKITLGRYPDMTLKQARLLIMDYAFKISKGIDPRLHIKDEKTDNLKSVSLNKAFEEWYAVSQINRVNHLQIKRTYEIHIKSKLGKHRVQDITQLHVKQTLQRIADLSPSVTSRALMIIKRSIDRHVTVNPCHGLTPSMFYQKTNKPKRALNDKELRLLLKVINESQMAGKNRVFLKLLLFFGCRGNELRLSKKSWFDFDSMTWSIPPEFHKIGSKTGMPVIRPLIPDIVPLIKDAFLLSGTSEYVFIMNKNKKPLSRPAVRSLSDSIIRSCARKNIIIKHWSVHDLRKTARTNWSKYGRREVREKMLGHIISGDDTYDLYSYYYEGIELYKQWHEYLCSIGF
jgi:integrase